MWTSETNYFQKNKDQLQVFEEGYSSSSEWMSELQITQTQESSF
jgi:hypothetical protein